MRLGLLGPAPPFHGGIVTWLAMLHRTLAARGHELHWAGFRRQYPDLLFPGPVSYTHLTLPTNREV